MAGNRFELGIVEFDREMTEDARAEALRIPHSQLLHEAFDALTGILDRHGYTPRFNHLRHVHSKRLLEYWAAQKAQFEAHNGENGGSIVNDDERIEMARAERYEDEDDKVLHITVKNPLEEATFSMTVNAMRGLDEFMYPPTVESKISRAPGEAPEYYYKVVFRNQRISTFARTRVMQGLGFLSESGEFMTDTRTIDCSMRAE